MRNAWDVREDAFVHVAPTKGKRRGQPAHSIIVVIPGVYRCFGDNRVATWLPRSSY